MAEENTKYPFLIMDIQEEQLAEVKKHLLSSHNGYVTVGPDKYFFPNSYKLEGPKIYNMEVRPTDIFVVTFPKSGTTWTQEMVWLLGNNLDYQTAKAVKLIERFPFLDGGFVYNETQTSTTTTLDKLGLDERFLKLMETLKMPPREMLEQMPRSSRRFIKTHLPLSLLPPALLDTAKVVYVARDPRDVAVSFYHHHKLMKLMGFEGNFKKFWDLFRQGKIDWTPYFPHVIEAWCKRNHPNMLFLFYEELIEDLPACIRRVTDFLGTAVTDEQVATLRQHLSFDTFKKNESVNIEQLRELGVLNPGQSFIRKGKAGGWREHFDEEMAAQAQRWIDDSLRGTDLRFPTVRQQ